MFLTVGRRFIVFCSGVLCQKHRISGFDYRAGQRGSASGGAWAPRYGQLAGPAVVPSLTPLSFPDVLHPE